MYCKQILIKKAKDEFLKNSFPFSFDPDSWLESKDTNNCYSYALNLQTPSTQNFIQCIYFPGAISNSPWIEIYSLEEMVKRVCEDLKVLGRDCYEASAYEAVPYGKQKISVLWSKHQKDFHFLRKDDSGIWSHKDGWDAVPSQKDHFGRIIKNPKRAFFGSYRFVTCFIY